MTTKTNYISLFSGIGGFEYGIQTSKHADKLRCIGYSEIDKYATSVYQKHYPTHPRLGDATQINTSELPDFDFLVGGFPCQAFSVAGKRRGFDDTRGTLFFEIARILRAKKPRYFLLENVRGLLSHDKGKTFQTILEVLADLGYNVQWQIYNSKNHGVPQNRERVYIKGYFRERERCTGEVLSVRGTMPETNVQGKLIPLNDKPQAQTIYDIGGVSCTLSANGGGQGGKTGLYNVTPSKYLRRVDDNRFSTGTKDNNVYALETRHRGQPFHKAQDNYVLQIKDNTKKGFHEAREGDSIQLANTTSNGKKVSSQISRTLSTSGTIATVTPGYRIRRLTPRECERLQGFPDDWTRYGATGEEMSDTQRYKMCGNAVTTNVIRDIMNDWNMTLTED